MWSLSRYCYWASLDERHYALYNGHTGAMYEFDEAEYRRITLEPGFNDATVAQSAMLTQLRLEGTLVADPADEARQVLEGIHRHQREHRLLELTLSPTYSCNFRCTYCYVDFVRGSMTDETARRILAFVRASLPKYRQVNATWFGGEPLLCLDRVLSVSRALTALSEETGKPIRILITTNGYLLTAARARELVHAGARYFHVTLDGTAEHHDRLRVLASGRGTHVRVLASLINLLDSHPEVIVTLRANVDQTNVGSTVTLLRQVPAGFRHRVQVHITPILSSDRVVTPELRRVINEQLAEALRLGYAYYDNLVSQRDTYCSASKSGNFQIGPDGRVHKCSPSGKPEVTIGHLLPDGSLLESKANRAWETAGELDSNCEDCRYLPLCAGGCRLNYLRTKRHTGCLERFVDMEQMIRNRYLALATGQSTKNL